MIDQDLGLGLNGVFLPAGLVNCAVARFGYFLSFVLLFYDFIRTWMCFMWSFGGVVCFVFLVTCLLNNLVKAELEIQIIKWIIYAIPIQMNETHIRRAHGKLHVLLFFRYSIASGWTAYMGIKVINRNNDNHVAMRSIKRIIVHPHYDQYISDYDIALLEMESPVFFNELVQPICLPSSRRLLIYGTVCYVTGWGAIKENSMFISGYVYCKCQAS